MDDFGGRKDDVSLPKATVVKLVKEYVPRDIRVAKETLDAMLDCCNEFINLLASEANEVCTREEKKTILPEHAIQALKDLGFSSYIEEVQAVHDHHRNETLDSPKPAKVKWANKSGGMTEEEAIAAQQKMFAEARARMQGLSAPAPATEPLPSEKDQQPE